MVHECRVLLIVTTGRFTADVRRLAEELPERLVTWDADILAPSPNCP